MNRLRLRVWRVKIARLRASGLQPIGWQLISPSHRWFTHVVFTASLDNGDCLGRRDWYWGNPAEAIEVNEC